jgi:hypothetical protein
VCGEQQELDAPIHSYSFYAGTPALETLISMIIVGLS